MAMRRPPSVPQPQPCDLAVNGGDGGDGRAGQVIHYPTDIQPIFDRKCVSCHGAANPAGKLRLTGEVTLFYNTSYEELARQHPQWVHRDPAVPGYNPADFRRKATFEEAIGFLAPPWHR